MQFIVINRSLDPMSREECLHKLADNQVGRLAVSVRGQPVIFPVNYVVDGDVVVFRSDPGSKLDAATLAQVAFEIDHVDSELKSGWSVVVQGVGRYITDAVDPDSERRRALPLDAWAPGDKEHWVEIYSPEITGRRLSTVTVSA